MPSNLAYARIYPRAKVCPGSLSKAPDSRLPRELTVRLSLRATSASDQPLLSRAWRKVSPGLTRFAATTSGCAAFIIAPTGIADIPAYRDRVVLIAGQNWRPCRDLQTLLRAERRAIDYVHFAR